MADGVKGRRYDASRRRAQSDETRQRVVGAARDLMLAQGYRTTTIAAIAARAGVNPDTVYTLVGPKPVLLRELVEQAISGEDRAVPAEERDFVQQIRAEPDAVRKLHIYAEALVRTQQRLAPLYKAIREAAVGEPEVAALWQEISNRRLANMSRFVADLEVSRPLRNGLDRTAAAQHVWLLNSPDVYLLLADEQRWSLDEIARWLATTWQRLLFDE